MTSIWIAINTLFITDVLFALWYWNKDRKNKIRLRGLFRENNPELVKYTEG